VRPEGVDFLRPMQKLMSALASLAAIVLFVAVAVTSSATSAFLAGYGFFFIAFLVPVVFWFFASRSGSGHRWAGSLE
jgi:hypothetical protein